MVDKAGKKSKRTDSAVREPLRVAIILNPTAGRRQPGAVAQLNAALVARGFACSEWRTNAAGHASELAKSAVADVVVAAGGDGTLNEVVNGLMRRPEPRPVLALFPLGTANVVANEIGLSNVGPQDLARLIEHGFAEPIFVGRVNERYFVQMVGVGLDAHVVRNVSGALKRRLGRFAYVWQTFVEIGTYRKAFYRVMVGAAEHRAASVVVANGRYYAGRFMAIPQANITDPNLQICLLERPGRLNMIRYGLGLLIGRLHRLPDVRVIPAASLRIEASTPGRAEPIQADGDVIGDLPALIVSCPGPQIIIQK